MGGWTRLNLYKKRQEVVLAERASLAQIFVALLVIVIAGIFIYKAYLAFDDVGKYRQAEYELALYGCSMSIRAQGLTLRSHDIGRSGNNEPVVIQARKDTLHAFFPPGQYPLSITISGGLPNGRAKIAVKLDIDNTICTSCHRAFTLDLDKKGEAHRTFVVNTVNSTIQCN